MLTGTINITLEDVIPSIFEKYKKSGDIPKNAEMKTFYVDDILNTIKIDYEIKTQSKYPQAEEN